MNYKKGFTLLEILLVVGIIAILAGIVIIAINPNKMLASARNTQRSNDLREINSALVQYYIDHNNYPASTTILSSMTEICNTGSASATTTSINGIDCGPLANLSDLVPVYLTAIPMDPKATSTANTPEGTPVRTGYKIIISANNKPVLSAVLAEKDTVITVGSSVLYTVYFNTDGGSAAPSPVTGIVYGNDITLPADPTKSGYNFSGWYTGGGGTGTVFTGSTAVTANITVYANWVSSDTCSHVASDPDCWSPDLGMMAWSSGVQPTTNASSTTNGFINTQLVKNSFVIANYPGFNTCYYYDDGVHPVGTWYLPAEQELVDAVQGAVGGWYQFVRYYWSSTEDTYGNPGSYAILVRSSDANVYPDIKTYASAYRVRCLR